MQDSSDFYKTIGGDEFYRGTMPRIAEASEAIANEMATSVNETVPNATLANIAL